MERDALINLVNQGMDALEAERFDEAVTLFAQATRHDPTDADNWKRLGYAYGELERHAEALSAYREALRLDPTDFDVQCDLAFLLDEDGQSAEALLIMTA